MEKSVKYALLITLLGLLFLGLTSCDNKTDEPTEKATITITSDKDLTIKVVVDNKIIKTVDFKATELTKTFTIDMPDSRIIKITMETNGGILPTDTFEVKVNNKNDSGYKTMLFDFNI
jgi:hypothetical protein